MSFQIALSGLNAASAELSVTANNIANANTSGFKQSRAEFADFFPVTAYGLSQNAIGGGARLERVAQQFSQGAVNFTNNSLDLAISGEGFFTVSDNGAQAYTRAGEFGTDRNGFVVNAAGQRLQVFPPITGSDTFDTARVTDLQLSTADNPPAPTSTIGARMNLPADATAPTVATFNATDPNSYNHTTSVTLYDSLGAAHSANLFFVKGAAAGEWTVHTQIDGNDVGAGQSLTYSSSGLLVDPADGEFTLPAYTPANGSAPLNINMNLSGATQYGDTFSVSSLTQDGYTTGRLAGIEVGAGGVVQARYTNGQATPLGQLALASFPNSQGLQQIGATSWGATFGSGQVILGPAGSNNLGEVQSGALEASNVDLTAQLVNMITAQRNFQANAQMISTSDQITQTVINIR